jgi:hypothetical protein
MLQPLKPGQDPFVHEVSESERKYGNCNRRENHSKTPIQEPKHDEIARKTGACGKRRENERRANP